MPKQTDEPEYTRPYQTIYYSSHHDRLSTRSSQGCSCTEQGAIRAAVFNIFLHKHVMAVIHDRYTGAPIFTVRERNGQLAVIYGSGLNLPPSMRDPREAKLYERQMRAYHAASGAMQ